LVDERIAHYQAAREPCEVSHFACPSKDRDMDVAEARSLQRVPDLVEVVVVERHIVERRRFDREMRPHQPGTLSGKGVPGVRVPGAEEISSSR
jgi:hypothetical protein